MAITFDNYLNYTQALGTLTVSYTNNGSYLVVGVFCENSNGVSASYGGVSMTQLTSLFAYPGSSYDFIFGLANPPTGTNNIVVSPNVTTMVFVTASSYSGTQISTSVEASTTYMDSGSGTISASVTTITDNDWLVGFGHSSTNKTAISGTTIRGTYSDYNMLDSNGALTPPGSFSLAYGSTGSGNDISIIALKPYTLNHYTRSLSDSIMNGASRFATTKKGYSKVLSDSIMNAASRFATLSRLATYGRALSASIMNGASRFVTLARAWATFRSLSDSIMNGASRFATLSSLGKKVIDTIINLSVSGYKWFTSTLWTAQQSSAVRPYFTARILDDSITYTQQTSATESPAYGKCITAPDGNILCVGYGSSISGASGLFFWKVTDPSVGVWNGYATALDAPNTNVSPFHGFCSIACSEYINGTYRIDVYYAYNNSGNVGINHKYSNDGGVTWNAGYTVVAPTMTFSDAQNGVYNFCIQAGKPILLSNGNIQSIIFYIAPNSNTFTTDRYTGYDIYYQRYGGTGSSFNAATKWSQKNVNSQDWTIHSFDVQYFNEYPGTQQTGQWLIVMSAFHNIFETINTSLSQANANYGLYLTYLENTTDSVTTDLWKEAVEILPTLSNSSINLDAFTFPEMRWDGTYINLLCRAVTTESTSSTAQGSTSLLSTTHTNYYLLTTQDGKNFSYPTAIASSSGAEFTDPIFSGAWGFVYQKGSYWILGSSGTSQTNNWQFSKNNVIADVTNSIIAYQVNDTVASASSVSLTIGNQESQWYGNTPTQPGYSAIKKNAKICINEGYYNANGVGETVPRNIYYIDDIQQNVSATANDLVLLGRDLYKRLMVTVTRFAFSLIGPYFYSDIFDGSTIGNWNQINGSWQETAASLNLSNPATNGSDSVVALSGVNQVNPSALMAVTFALPTGSTNPVFIYPYYQDSTHWVRLEISNSNDGNNYMVWAIAYMFGGTRTVFDSGTYTENVYSASPNYTFLARRYDWYKFSFFVGSNGDPTGVSDTSGNTPFMFSFSNATPTGTPTMFSSLSGGAQNGEFDATSNFDLLAGGATSLGTVALGVNSVISASLPAFKHFKFCEYTSAQNISDIQRFLGVKAGIFNYKLQNTIADYLYTAVNDYTGTFTVQNRDLTILAGNSAINNISSKQLGNAEIEFDAQLTPTVSTTNSGFSLIFRSAAVNNTNCYLWNNGLRNSGAFSYSRFQLNTNQSTPYTYSGTFLLNSSSLQYDISSLDLSPIYTNNINVDFTKWNHFKIIMTDGWFLGFINGIMVVAWQDNNTTQAYLKSGYWGFQSDANSTVKIKNITSSAFWNNIQSFSLNPGDDMESAMEGVEQTIFGWHFSDLLGRFKNIIFSATDPSTYTYQTSIVNQQLDTSDKEYVNQVKVYGASGIMATARDTTSIGTTGNIREKVVTDFKIQTYQDAQKRADQELIDAEKFSNQYTPSQTLNVGSELFDVVTIINTGTNSSGTNATSRNYGQTISVGGTSAANYSLQLDAGNL